jgi:hypothetical protein
MPLHTRVKGEELDGQYLSVNPLYAREGESIDIPKHSHGSGWVRGSGNSDVRL